MNRWFYFNFTVLLFAIWKISTSHMQLHILFGALGLFTILFNWTRHAVFSTIREAPERTTKIKYAQFSKRILPFHKWIGTSALIFIFIHASIIFYNYNFQFTNKKMTSGFFALIILSSIVIVGWFRWYKTTVLRRYVHLTLGYTIFFFIIIHLLF